MINLISFLGYILLIASFLLPNYSISDEEETVELIVMLKKGIDFNQEFSASSERASETFHLKSSQSVSKSLNIWAFKIRSNRQSIDRVLTILNENPKVIYVQRNHQIQYRAIPNDIDFKKQWQYYNNGNTNKVLDADIDATEAWEITQGGETIHGDEIVIAIIDNGFKIDHPDLEGNIWTNLEEIPNNNIDDDHNGYIDDYYGWNFKSESNDVTTNNGIGKLHGTAVSGIIGAKGNNDIGVSGVNWNIKLLNIVGGGTDEVSVIRAYDYVLELRKKYNHTNGQSGAFIVATNASWGINFGKAEESPIWCAFYDALGEEGILNVGATINENVNVDIHGDLPTTCSSDYLISVTNTTSQDQKFKSAGYGSQSIDLGAPGEKSYTITNTPALYSSFGGTSAATPHVTGTIGLLYSVPCLELMKEAKENPQKTASLMKAFILAGVDEIEDLKGITHTGGRLNIYKSIKELQKYYGCENSSADLEEYGVEIHNVYPNPANDWIRLIYEINDKDNNAVALHVTINNSIGEYMNYIQHLGTKKNGHYELELDTSNLKAGVYFLSIRRGNKPIKAEKIIIL